MRLCRTCALLALLLLAALDPAECLQEVVRPDKGSTVTVSTKLPLNQCAVCTVSGVNDTETSCHSSLILVPEVEVKLLFKCTQPAEQSFTVTIARSIECTKDVCSPTAVETQPSILTAFARTFTWELKAPEKTVVGLSILGAGLMETLQPCLNGYQFSVATSKNSSKGQTQYCRGGSVTHLDLANQAVVSLQVKPKGEVEPLLFQTSAGPLKMVINVDSSTTVILSRDPKEPECEVCTTEGSTPACSTKEKTLTSAEKLSVEFSCPKPQDVFNAKIKKTIECTKNSCKPPAAEIDPKLFKEFKRSLMWEISVPDRTALTLNFPGYGLEGISAAENCQDGYQYSVSTSKSDEVIKTNSYCKGGTVSHLDLSGPTNVTVEVPKGAELDVTAFNVKSAPRASRMMSVTPDPNTIIIITRVNKASDCTVCVGKAPNQQCKPQILRLTDPRNTSVEFTCTRPQDVFNVEINREIDCTEASCSGDIVQAESSLFPDFNRTFTWDLKVASPHTFQLDFPEPGMRQISSGETCPDEHMYSLVIYLRSGPATIGNFCKGGTVTTVQARYKGRVSLQVPGDATLDPVDFKLGVGPETSMMAIVKVNLPRGSSDTKFTTPNYPRDFPDKEMIQWNFAVPGMHNYTMTFHDRTAPECLNNEVEVEYKTEAKKATKLSLTDPQPQHQQGNFNMTLKNCETNRTLQGLTLNYRISVMRSGHPVLCTVDLTKHPGVSLHIEKVGSDPYCEMSINSEVKDKINVAAGTIASLAFLDCPKEEVRLTASELIEYTDLASHHMTTLTVPTLEPCLPMPLHSFTWHLNIPEDNTLDLMSPTGSLRQSLPGQECNEPFLLHVAEQDGSSVGDFCINGVIEKVQVHTNISITATAQDFNQTKGPFLNLNISQEIPETIIYRVTPQMEAPTLLATPNWPQGMKPFSTISWIVTLPHSYQANLQFNVSQPHCEHRHTAIKVMLLGSKEELLSRREDENLEKLSAPQSFFLNMSNCKPETGKFSALTTIILQKKSNLLAILLGLAGVLLLFLIVLAAVCIITKKQKKERLNKETSIYMGKGNIFRPSDMHFTKTRSDNESHVYDSIDDTMIYSHLMGDSTYSDSLQDRYKGIKVDTYNSFTGPADGVMPVIKEPEPENEQYNTFLSPSETFIPSRPRTPISRQESLGFEDRRMVDNELYTFKNIGEMNTIQLSGSDMQPQPPITQESL